MILRGVEIRNFRCFQHVKVELDETTVLIGENNSGKTSFMEAIRLCLSRPVSRRGGLDDYDYYLAPDKTTPSETGDLAIILDFVLDDKDPDDIVQVLGDVVVQKDDGTKGHVCLRLNSRYDAELKDFGTDLQFLDATDSPLRPKLFQVLLNRLLQLRPVFYLSALRDAVREFHGRAAFWAPLLRNLDIPDAVRDRLQEEVNALNDSVLKAHAPLQEAKKYLAKLQEIMALDKGGAVDIEALPARVLDLLSRTQVSITAPTGVPLPLARHGAGMQSLAVIFLFEAFCATMLAQQYDSLSQPILALEEPEAHLHPCAVRSLWASLEHIPGQKIIATHSGDLLARVPVSAIRRFCRKNGTVAVRAVRPDALSTDELKRVEFHLQSCRGELLFARCWLLGEGESEYWVFREVAEILGHDLDRLGVRIVNTRYSGVEPLVKVAEALGIGWCFVGDGDGQGDADAKTCEKYLQGRDPAKHLFVLRCRNMEVLLCESGFGQTFENNVSAQKRRLITVPRGDPEYWAQIVGAQPDKNKPGRVREAMADMRAGGPSHVPSELSAIIQAAVAIAGDQA